MSVRCLDFRTCPPAVLNIAVRSGEGGVDMVTAVKDL